MRTMLTASICVSALLIAFWMLRRRQWIWATVFATIALLFNPIFVLSVGSSTFLAAEGVALVAFMTLAFFQAMPRLTAESIISDEPRRSSL